MKVSIHNIAKEAYELRMIMRKSKEGYLCRKLDVEPGDAPSVHSFESWVESQAVEGGKNNQGGDQIAYTLFGSLIKSLEGRDIVLQKAQVVLRRQL